MEIPRTGTHGEIKRGHRLKIMIEHVGLGCDHDLEGALLAQKIWGKNFDASLRATHADGTNGAREMPRSTIYEIVAIDRGDDNVGQAKLRGRICDTGWFIVIKRNRKPGFHVAESASARAGVSHDHEGCVFPLPALADIRTARLLAHGVQTIVAHNLLRSEIARRHRRFNSNPVRFLQNR